ncbi:MAG: hypothetical protein O9274_01100 [Limnobacter sp.]|uniref:hypothetical protein n=1 Tax=Limnobacter sp. TaxID=2003368 RepID=UPI0022C13D6C|nr:hypothetical protein [Limnobacter sp.]MCZ8014270.1 hypothetical protein [Limnobacter sp.]
MQRLILAVDLRIAACSLRLAACGLRLAACGLRLAACGLRLAACGLRRSLNHQSLLQRKFAALRGIRLLHHLADSGQGFPADSQRGAIPTGSDAKTL